MSAPHATAPGAGVLGGRRLIFASLPSTNEWALANAAGCGHGDVVWARRQTAGRGRAGRAWLTPDERGLALSIVLREVAAAELAPHGGQVAAIALVRLLGRYGLKGRLKWPNDVLVGDGKIAGILSDRDPSSGAVVIGVGLNVNVTAADWRAVELMRPATSMRIESGSAAGEAPEYVVDDVLDGLLDEFSAAWSAFSASGRAWLLAEWAAADYLAGQRIRVHTGDAVLSGSYAGLDGSARLRLRQEDGAERLFWTGDVERLVAL